MLEDQMPLEVARLVATVHADAALILRLFAALKSLVRPQSASVPVLPVARVAFEPYNCFPLTRWT